MGIFYVYITNKGQVKRKFTKYNNYISEDQINTYNQKLIYKAEFNSYNEITKHYDYYVPEYKKNALERFKRWFLR